MAVDLTSFDEHLFPRGGALDVIFCACVVIGASLSEPHRGTHSCCAVCIIITRAMQVIMG